MPFFASAGASEKNISTIASFLSFFDGFYSYKNFVVPIPS